MIPNNNLSVLPWYNSIDQQNARKWWIYDRIYPLFVPAGYMLPFQLIIPHTSAAFSLDYFKIFKADGTLVGNYRTNILNGGLRRLQFESFGYDVILFPGNTVVFSSFANGQYYIEISVNSSVYYSEVYTVVNDISPYLKLEWWDVEDFIMDAGRIVYKYSGTQFKNRLYLMADIAKPEYSFEEDGDERDGYFYPTKMISRKNYKFNFLASEYLLDVMRFIRMSDYIQITKSGLLYSVDTFLITPEWESNGDVAGVEAEFSTATVAKKIGVGYIRSIRGDFNDDFNVDFNNA